MFDLIIVGCGPAGLSAGLYAGRGKLNTLILGSVYLGTAYSKAIVVENYAGINSISGRELVERMYDQVKDLKSVSFKHSRVERISKADYGFDVTIESGDVLKARTVIIASGVTYKKLGVPGEKEFLGRGVSYCAVCDANFFKEKIVAVVGNDNHAVQSAIYLNDFSSKTFIISKNPEWDDNYSELIDEKGIEVVKDEVVEIKGKDKVSGLKLKNKELSLDGVFIVISEAPVTSLLEGLNVSLEKGFIKVGKNQETNVPCLYAAGDVTGGVLQIAKAVGEGCTASVRAIRKCKES